MQSREYRECENAESECRLRECRVESTDSRVKGRERKECENAESRVQSECTEYRVDSTESATAQSRGEGAECTMRAQCESTESARAHSRQEGVQCTMRAKCERTE